MVGWTGHYRIATLNKHQELRKLLLGPNNSNNNNNIHDDVVHPLPNLRAARDGGSFIGRILWY